MRIALRAFVIGLLIYAAPSKAWWNIWQIQELKQEPAEPVLKSIRENSCGDPARTVSRFGDTSFMRLENQSEKFPEAFTRAMIAAFLSETAEEIGTFLTPFLTDDDPEIRSAAHLYYARALMRRHGLASQEKSRILQLLSEPLIASHPDRAYLMASLAAAERNWENVQSYSQMAIQASPEYYNAWVLRTLARLHDINQRAEKGASCRSLALEMQNDLQPLLSMGACPIHTAHLELAIRRFLGDAVTAAQTEMSQMRGISLAYVARNDPLCKKLKLRFQSDFPRSSCNIVIENLKCE